MFIYYNLFVDSCALRKGFTLAKSSCTTFSCFCFGITIIFQCVI